MSPLICDFARFLSPSCRRSCTNTVGVFGCAGGKVIHSFAGVRAKSSRGDWIIEECPTVPRFIQVSLFSNRFSHEGEHCCDTDSSLCCRMVKHIYVLSPENVRLSCECSDAKISFVRHIHFDLLSCTPRCTPFRRRVSIHQGWLDRPPLRSRSCASCETQDSKRRRTNRSIRIVARLCGPRMAGKVRALSTVQLRVHAMINTRRA
jgi:hypothetical protein